MPSRRDPPTLVSRSDIFRQQALDAWRGQGAEPPTLLELSPSWIPWALSGVLLIAAAGVIIAANMTIPRRVTGPAVIIPSTSGDSLIVEAVLPDKSLGSVAVGQLLWFRSDAASVRPVALQIMSVVQMPYPTMDRTRGQAGTMDERSSTALRFLVRGGRLDPDPSGGGATLLRPGMSGTAQVLTRRESPLQILRPHPPGRRAE